MRALRRASGFARGSHACLFDCRLAGDVGMSAAALLAERFLLGKVVEFLDAPDLSRASQACRALRDAVASADAVRELPSVIRSRLAVMML